MGRKVPSRRSVGLVSGAKLRGLPVQERLKADFGSNRSFVEGFLPCFGAFLVRLLRKSSLDRHFAPETRATL